MPDTVPAGDETLLHALPEDQPDSLSEGHKSKQADIDETPAQKAGTPDNGSKGEDPIVTNEGIVDADAEAGHRQDHGHVAPVGTHVPEQPELPPHD